MPKRSLEIAIRAWVLGCCMAAPALGQVPAASPEAQPTDPPADALPAPPDPPPSAAAAPRTAAAPAPNFVPPPGYKLVREDDALARDDPPPPKATELPYEDGDPVPPGYIVRDRPRRGLIIAGSIVTGVPWALSVTGAAATDYEDKTGYLIVPGIGPWLMLLAGGARDRDCGSMEFCSENRAGLRAILVFDGLVQSAGAAMFVAGLVVPRKRLVPTSVDVSVVPLKLSADGYGVGAFGTF